MRTYLVGFFEEFAYSPDDADCLLRAYDAATANAAARDKFEEALGLYDADIHCDYDQLISLADDAAAMTGIHEYTLELLLFICLSRRLQAIYRERGIDEALFHRSMLDLRYKLEECKAVKGIVGSFVAWWFKGFFDLTRFGIGRLQFEIVDFEAQYEADGVTLTPDSKVINVHIPRSGEPLDEASCRDAYARAAAFFKSDVGETTAFVCHSWLLYPENKTILPERSNIRRFMMLYHIVDHGIDKHRSDLWRLFDTDEQRPDKLPTDTSVRRCYAEHLQNGGKLGWGYGVLIWK